MADPLSIDVPLDVVDGWPPSDVETLEAIATADETFVIAGIPVFALDLSVGDTVEARPGPDGVPRFERRIREGGHATFRLISLGGDDDLGPVVHRLEQLGARVVPSSFASLWAVDVPPEAPLEAIRAALAEATARGVVEFEDPRTP